MCYNGEEALAEDEKVKVEAKAKEDKELIDSMAVKQPTD